MAELDAMEREETPAMESKAHSKKFLKKAAMLKMGKADKAKAKAIGKKGVKR